MSIESLLIAAQYLDYKDEVEARGEQPQDYETYFTEEIFPKDEEVSDDANQGKNSRKHDKSVNRETHNRLEKYRRAQMREGFDVLKKMVPTINSPKISNLALLRETTKYIRVLRAENELKKSELRRLEIKNVGLASKKKTVCDTLDSHIVEMVLNKKNKCDKESSTSSTSECEEVGASSKKRKFSFSAFADAVEEVRSKCLEEFETTENEVVLTSLPDDEDDEEDEEEDEKMMDSLCENDLNPLPYIMEIDRAQENKILDEKDEFRLSYAQDLLSLSKCAANIVEVKVETNATDDSKPENTETELLKELKKADGGLKKRTLIKASSIDNKDHFLRKSMHNYSALPVPDTVSPPEPGKKIVQSSIKATAVVNGDDSSNNIVVLRPSTMLTNGLLASVSESDGQLSKVVMNSYTATRHIGKPLKILTSFNGLTTCKPIVTCLERDKSRSATGLEKETPTSSVSNGLDTIEVKQRALKETSRIVQTSDGKIKSLNIDQKAIAANFIDGNKLSVLTGPATIGAKQQQNIILQVPSSIMPSLKPLACLPEHSLAKGETIMPESLQNTTKSFHSFENHGDLNQTSSKLFFLSFPNTG